MPKTKTTEIPVDDESTKNYSPSALTHEFIPDFDLSRIRPNPYNVRNDAVADDELVASVRENGLVEPLIVAPAILEDGPAVEGRDHDLVAGHRRLNALDRCDAKTAPVIIRYDLDTRTKQVETMIIENDRRRGLTPIEQAKGYKQLTLFGVSQADVAKSVGVDRKTVAARLKLLNLNNTAQQRVSDGQITIDDAIAIAALPANEQTKVAKAAGTWSFKNDLESARRRVKRGEEIAARIKDLKAAGIPERSFATGKTIWNINDADDGMVRLGSTFSNNHDDHAGCLAFVKVTGPELEYVCTNVAGHDDQLDERQRLANEEAERAAAERKAHEDAEAIAQRLRMDAILDSIKPGVKVDPAVDRLLRLLLRSLVFELGYDVREYFEALQIPKAEQWEQYSSSWKTDDITHFEQHMSTATKPGDVVKRIAAAFMAKAEGRYLPYVGDKGPRSPHAQQAQDLGNAYFGLAQASGHELTAVELELLNPPAEEDQ